MLIPRQTIRGRVDGPRLLITAGVHGDEFAPMAAVRRLARSIDPASLAGSVTLAPVVNVAAFRLGRRCGPDHLDLARVCPGDPSGSITMQTAAELAALIRQSDFYIDLHTGGAVMSLLPLAGYVLHTDAAVRDRQRAMAQAFNLPVVWATTPEAEGRSLSVARDADVPAIYAEYYGGAAWDAGCVAAYVDGCMNVMGLLGMLDRPPPPSRVAHVAEDPRPQSGHLQICHPAPHDGFFEPSVRLGQRVRPGDRLGALWAPEKDQETTILAAQGGIVLGLRIFSRVEADDALAVILESPAD